MDKNGYNESLLTGWKHECYFTGETNDIVRHEIFYGTANRKLSKEYGMWVYLIPELHNTTNQGVHFNKKLDLFLKQAGQRAFEDKYSHEEFMRVFGKNYLEE